MILLIILDFIFRNGVEVAQLWNTNPVLFILLLLLLA